MLTENSAPRLTKAILSLTIFCCAVGLSCADKNNPVIPPAAVQLVVQLDSSLDRNGAILADSISSAIMTDTAGAVVATAQISSGNATIDLNGIGGGNYFITINGLSEDRIPTRLAASADSFPNMTQLVGKGLDESLIISGSDTLFRLRTFLKSHGAHPVRAYSNGADISPHEYAYAIESFLAGATSLEIRVDSTAALLLSETGQRRGPHPPGTWMLGENNHGTGPAGDLDSTAAQCQNCHANFDTKPMQWSMITPMRGYCYKCHYGSGGPMAGIIDPAR